MAVLSPSAGLPSRYPAVYEAGLRFLREGLGLTVLEMPSARASNQALHIDPRGRATDLHDALREPAVKAIIASCGGEEAVRLLPYLAPELFTAHPKILLGSSDFTAVLSFAAQLGLVTFYGPSVMVGLAQAPTLGAPYVRHLEELLFAAPPEHEYRPWPTYSDGLPDWDLPGEPQAILPPRENKIGWRFLQGAGRARGRLWGGSLEVIIFLLQGSPYMPPTDFFDGRILLLEAASAATRPAMVRWALRGLGMAGILDRISGLLLGRVRNYTGQEQEALERSALDVVATEFGRKRLPVVAHVDFGHTLPQLLFPMNGLVEIDCAAGRLWLAEAALME